MHTEFICNPLTAFCIECRVELGQKSVREQKGVCVCVYCRKTNLFVCDRGDLFQPPSPDRIECTVCFNRSADGGGQVKKKKVINFKFFLLGWMWPRQSLENYVRNPFLVFLMSLPVLLQTDCVGLGCEHSVNQHVVKFMSEFQSGLSYVSFRAANLSLLIKILPALFSAFSQGHLFLSCTC